MTTSSGAIGNTSIDQYNPYSEDRVPKNAASEVAKSPACAGCSKEQTKFDEMIRKATSPNLKNLDRELEIKIRLDTTRGDKKDFALLAELFKIKLEALKAAGISSAAFLEEIKSYITTHVLPIIDQDPQLMKEQGIIVPLALLLAQEGRFPKIYSLKRQRFKPFFPTSKKRAR